ncbi:hypothetical protein BIW11_07096 [Tropilaelaps mercedesae]|uniref:Uncharacterized protein n=1 Tax=Tropilaelaps mercedesae TaxID=418985 RepID=A0A1V9XVH8_9ACAR|nr:hypothetical protein BIW11_07096 [Tropilaelaps mercedesae]
MPELSFHLESPASIVPNRSKVKFGPYGLSTVDGRQRIINYDADEAGLRASIITNAPLSGAPFYNAVPVVVSLLPPFTPPHLCCLSCRDCHFRCLRRRRVHFGRYRPRLLEGSLEAIHNVLGSSLEKFERKVKIRALHCDLKMRLLILHPL